MYDIIYLSPHLDDAALSCGGQIAQRTRAGHAILIVTLFTGDPPPGPLSRFAALLHERWELGDRGFAPRREEDEHACVALGAACQHWGLPDCIYRHDAAGANLYPTWEDITAGVHPADETLIESIRERLTGLPAAATVVAPLGVGGHADHRLTRQAAERWRGADLLYYEDYPYVAREGALAEVIGDGAGWAPIVIPLEATDVRARIAAIACYTSQLTSLFVDRADMEVRVSEAVARVGGERLWRKKVRESGD